MKIRLLALGLLCAGGLLAQRQRFSWQDYCFKNPGSPVCPGHEFAVKRSGGPPNSKSAPAVTSNPSPSIQRAGTPSMLVLGSIDWRFADPAADALVGINLGRLMAAPLTRSLMVQLGARQGLTEADLQKLFDTLSGVDEIALSIHNGRTVMMATGHAADSAPSSSNAGAKVMPLSPGSLLAGPAEAVDAAAQRIQFRMAPGELAQLAEQWHGASDFWAIGSARLLGLQAIADGIQRFSLLVSIQDLLITDLALEFGEAPDAKTVRRWQTDFGVATLEGATLHVRTSMDTSQLQKQIAQFAGQPAGQQLAALIQAAKYLPPRDASAPKPAKPVIYGLDSGPKEVSQDH